MSKYDEMYEKKVMTAEQALGLIKDHDYIFSAQAAGEPAAILDKMQYLKQTGVKDVIMNTCLPLKDYPWLHDQEMRGIMDHNGWFFNAGCRVSQKEHLTSAIPQSSNSILRKTMDRIRYEHRRPVVVATVSPMDIHGYMSLSVSAIYEKDLINLGAFVMLEVNPNFPRTFGDTQVHVSQADVLVESDRPIPCIKLAPYTETDEIIGRNIADLIEDGSTIQLGVGNIPNAVAHELRHKKHLGIHTEMFTETMVALIECGAIDNSQKGFCDGYSVCSFTLGSQKLYDYINNNPSIMFKSCTFANSPYIISKNNKFVSINATLEVDLTGQCASETVGNLQWSGTGGQSETVQGSQMSKGGKSILAMHSTYTTKDANGKPVLHSKIVPFLAPGAAVTTSRNDTDYVVTEYGVAWLRALNIRERVDALIKIAHPDFREWLRAEAEKHMIW